MPVYLYTHCGEEFEIVKSMEKSSDPEHCPKCFINAERVFTTPQISPSAKAFEPHFNYGLGKKVSSKREIKEHLAKIKGETGKEIVEVGTDNLSSIQKKKNPYQVPQGEIDAIKASFGG